MEELTNKQNEWVRAMKLKALEMALSTGSNGSHIGGALSSMEIFSVLYTTANVRDMKAEDRDRIIVSKGHCVLSYYTALWQYGYITEEELNTFDTDGTHYHGHPSRNLEKGIEFSAGSLGLGLSYAVGVGIACKKKGLKNRIYVVVGDGECDEGIVWEALMSISHYKLDNMTIIIDHNKYQLDGEIKDVMELSSLTEKMSAFGMEVISANGHSCEELTGALQVKASKPCVVIADTIKGNGVSFLINNKMAHQCPISRKQYEKAVSELEEL